VAVLYNRTMSEREPNVYRNAALLLATNVYRVACNAALFFIIARVLGSAELGRYQFALSFAALFGIAVHLGLNDLIIRQVAAAKEKAGYYLTHAFFIKSAVGVLVTATTIGVIVLSGKPPATWELVALASITLSMVAGLDTIIVAFFYAFERMGYVLALGVVRSTLLVGLGSAAVFTGTGARGVLWVLLAAEVVYFVLAFILMRKRLGIGFERLKPSDVPKFVREGVPFALNGIFVIVYGQLHYTLLGFWAGDTATGEYTAAAKPVNFLSFIPSAVTQALFPFLSRRHATSPGDIARPLGKTIRYLLALSVPAALFAFLRADELVYALFGSQYAESVIILRVLAFAVPIVFCGYPLWAAMNAIRREKQNTTVTGLAVAVNVAANVVLIPLFGPIGAAISYVATEATQNVIRTALLYKYVGGFGLISNAAAVFPATVVLSVLLLLPFELNVFLEIPAYGIIYIAVILLTRGVSYKELLAIIRPDKP
jgi:O-antigen/teichoic acid export membrane protein